MKIYSTYFLFIFLLIQISSCSDELIKDNNYKEKINLLDFTNEINASQLDLPIAISMASKVQDTLDSYFENINDSVTIKLFFKHREDIDTLNVFNNDGYGITIYKEGDLDGDGLDEIGILYSYSTSSCREYEIYSIKNYKWKLLHSVNTHLPDRAEGVNYFRNMGDKLRIIEARRGECCQCEGLDTLYIKHKYVK